MYVSGLECLSEYPSKAHTGHTHDHVRPYYIHIKNSPRTMVRAAKPSSQRSCAEIQGDPYYKKIPLPRIHYYLEPGLTALSGVTAAAASATTVEYPQLSPICERTVELLRIMMSSHSTPVMPSHATTFARKYQRHPHSPPPSRLVL